MNIFIGLMIPFLGTTLGSAMVFFMRKEMKAGVQKFLSGFAAGVMVAASVWSLLIPAMEMSEPMGKLAFVPAAVENNAAHTCSFSMSANCRGETKMKRLKAPALRTNKAQLYFWIYLFLLPCVFIFLAFYLMPIVTVVVTSFCQWDGFNAPKFDGLTNYTKMFQNKIFYQSLWNLLGWAFIAATLHVGFGILMAFIFREKPKGCAQQHYPRV